MKTNDKLGEIFVSYITDKGLIVLIYKKLVKVEKDNQSLKKWVRNIGRSQEKIQMTPKQMKGILNLTHTETQIKMPLRYHHSLLD